MADTSTRRKSGPGIDDAPVRWAIVGWGTGGRVFHLPMLRAAQGISPVAVVASPRHDGDPALSGLARVASLAALSRAGVEAVTITTPAGTHERLAREALDLGLHVVVDKPFALTAEGASELVRHARSAQRVLSVYQNRRWDGDLLTLAALIRDGVIGRPLRLTSRIRRFRPDLPAWNVGAPASKGGGTLLDLAPHLIDQASVLLGEIVSVDADLARLGPGQGAEDDVLLRLEHAGGARSIIEASVSAATQGPRFQLDGSEGGAWVDGFDVQETDLFADRTPTLLGDAWGAEPAQRRLHVVTGRGETAVPLLPGRWTRFYPAMAQAILTGSPPPVDPRDAVATARVIDAARVSSRQARTVRLARDTERVLHTSAPNDGDSAT